MENAKRFFGLFTITDRQGRKSVQVVEGSARIGFATEDTARAKLAERVAKRNAERPGCVTHALVMNFESNEERYGFVKEVNRLAQR